MREDSSNRPSPPSAARKLSPEDIALPPGYEIDVFAHGLTTPINLIFTPEGEMLVADTGIISGKGKVQRKIYLPAGPVGGIITTIRLSSGLMVKCTLARERLPNTGVIWRVRKRG